MRINRPLIPTGMFDDGAIGLDSFNNQDLAVYSLVSKPDRSGRPAIIITQALWLPVLIVNGRSGVLKFCLTSARNYSTFTTPSFGMRCTIDGVLVFNQTYVMPSNAQPRDAGLMIGGTMAASGTSNGAQELGGFTMGSLPWKDSILIEAINNDFPSLEVASCVNYHYTS